MYFSTIQVEKEMRANVKGELVPLSQLEDLRDIKKIKKVKIIII